MPCSLSKMWIESCGTWLALFRETISSHPISMGKGILCLLSIQHFASRDSCLKCTEFELQIAWTSRIPAGRVQFLKTGFALSPMNWAAFKITRKLEKNGIEGLIDVQTVLVAVTPIFPWFPGGSFYPFKCDPARIGLFCPHRLLL